MTKRFSLVMMACVCVILLPVAAFAQTGTLSGTVRNTSSIAVEGVNVKAVDVSDPYNFFNANNPTNASGAYTVSFVDQGTYDLNLLRSNSQTVISPGPVSDLFEVEASADVFVTGGSTTSEDLTLPDFANVTGRTRNNGQGVGSVNVVATATGANSFTCQDSTYSDVQTTVTTAGDYSLTLLPGVYDFTATFPNTQTVSKTGVTVANGTVVNLDLGNVLSVTGAQKLTYNNTGGSYYFLFNYNTGAYSDGNTASGDIDINYTLPPAQWIGAFLYDYADAGWQRGIYILSESLY